MEKYIGKKLDGRYEVQELIGIGGMANVYKAHDLIEDRTVAVKILREEFLSNEEFIRRFKNESKAIAVLSHPNIVKVYDVSFSETIHSIVMEYINGITLKEYIEQQKRISGKEAVHFVVQILRAIQHAHDRGIIHRDIKPQNIMLLQDGTIKVTDFGIARFARSETKTITDKAIGSVHYISPEQAYGKPVDGRSDIYSIGVMLFEMLTGTLPFDADSAVSVALKQIQLDPTRPRDINPDISLGLEQITLRAMQKDITKRYQSAAEMLRDIDEFKRNPEINFDYKYNSDKDSTKYYKTVKETPKKPTSNIPKFVQGEKSPTTSIVSGVVTGFIVSALLFVLAMVVVANPFTRNETINCPNFIGTNIEDAKKQYPNLTFIVEEEEFHSEYTQGVIYDQDPKSDRSIKANTSISVKVSKGTKTVIVPDFTNEDYVIANAKLKGMGFKVTTSYEVSSSIDANKVIRTSPAKNEKAIYGSTITVYVSEGTGQKPVMVPDVRYYSLDEARKILEANGLEVGEITQVKSTEKVNTVISQSPIHNSQVAAGTRINLSVSGGRNPQNTVSLAIKMPSISSTVRVQGYIDGVLKINQYMVPADIGTWNADFTGSGLATVKIVIDSKDYQEFAVDFDSGLYIMSADYSKDFE